jgi:hypothetical protein
MQAHRSRVAFGVIGIDDFHGSGRKSNQDDDMAVDAIVQWPRQTGRIPVSAHLPRAQADRRPQILLHRIVENASIAAAWILHAIRNAALP